MPDTLTTAKGLTKQTIGGHSNSWGTGLNDDLELIDKAIGQVLTKAIAGDTTMSASDAQYAGYNITGALAAGATLTWPTYYGKLYVENNTTGGFTITATMAAGTTVAIPPGEGAFIWSTGTGLTPVGGRLSTDALVVPRMRQASTRYLYVATTGSDTANTGRTVGSPYRTLQKAVTVAMGQDNNSQIAVVQVADGTYTAGFSVAGAWAGCQYPGSTVAQLWIVGNTTTPSNVVIADASAQPAAIIASDGAAVTLQGLKITSANGAAIFPQYGATITLADHIVFGACAAGQIHAETGGAVKITTGYTINGSAPAHLQAVLGGVIIFNETLMTVTVSGTPAFSTGFADIESGSVLYCHASFISFSGSATGVRYKALGGFIETITATRTFFPGDVNGVTALGGRISPDPTPTSLSAVTGLGGAGTAVLTSGSSDYAGSIQLTAQAGAASSGQVQINFGSNVGQLNSVCVAGVATGTGGWASGATVSVFLAGTDAQGLKWNNNGTALSAGSTYYINYLVTGIG